MFGNTKLLETVKTSANITSNILDQIKASSTKPGTGQWYAVGTSKPLPNIPVDRAGTWCAFPNAKTVTFDVDGGSEVQAQIVAPGEKIIKPIAPPTKAGQGFAGWYSDLNLRNPFDFDTKIVANTTVYAAWVELFEDVTDASDFFYEAVYEGARRGFMTGYSGAKRLFGPWDNMDRQTVAVALYKLAGSPAISSVETSTEMAKFTDRDDIAYWAVKGIAWCSKTGKFTGINNGDGTFTAAPAQEATREMIATFLWRYAGKPTVTASPEFGVMPDKGYVSGWAATGMKWCMSKGIITGVDDAGVKYIQPFGSAYRGAMITMLVRGHKHLV